MNEIESKISVSRLKSCFLKKDMFLFLVILSSFTYMNDFRLGDLLLQVKGKACSPDFLS